MDLYSLILGEENTKDLIILHGYLGMSDNWKTLGTAFSNAGFRVHLVDQRNHGRSFHSDEFSYELMVEDLIRYMDHNQIKQTSILGHSMGGKTAMFATTTYPERFDRLIVADIAPKEYAPHHQVIIAALLELSSQEITSRAFADQELSKHIKDFGIRQFLLKNLYRKEDKSLGFRPNIKVLGQHMKSIGKALEIDQKFEKPTLFIRGEQSDYILDEDQFILDYHFPQNQLQSIPKAGHWLHAEDPKRFYEIVVAFLK